MKEKINTLPVEIQEMAMQVSEKKQEEIQTVLNQVFNGTADWNKQVESINVKDINDTMSIELANTARKNAKTARLSAEKIFNAKRSEVQNEMRDYKLEDSLWLKAMQIMQLKFKSIEEKAKFKADFVIRHQQETTEKLQIERASKLEKYNVEVIPDYLGKMEIDVWNNYILGVENNFKLQQEIKEKAEKERIAKEKAEKLYYERLNQIAPYSDFDTIFELNIDTTVEIFNKILDNLINQKRDYDNEQEKIRLENDRLIKEREEREKQEKIRVEKEATERKEREEKQRIEKEKQEAKLKKEREEREKTEQKLQEKIKAEKQAEINKQKEIEAELKKGDSAKINDLIADLRALKEKYSFKSKQNQKLYTDVSVLIEKIVTHINLK